MRYARVTSLILIALLAFPAHAGKGFFGLFAAPPGPSVVEGFHFDYQIYQGDKVGLLQVFDDGAQTYFQFHDLDLKRIPVIWTENSSGARQAVRIEATSPYLVVNDVARKFVLAFGSGKNLKEASVVSVGGEPVKRAPAETTDVAVEKPEPRARTEGAITPKLTSVAMSESRAHTGSAPTAHDYGARRNDCSDTLPVNPGKTINVPFADASIAPTRQAQDDLQTMAKNWDAGYVVVRGRPSPGGGVAQARERAEAIRALLIRSGVAPSRITVATEGSTKPGSAKGVFFSEIVYGSSSGFMVLDGC